MTQRRTLRFPFSLMGLVCLSLLVGNMGSAWAQSIDPVRATVDQGTVLVKNVSSKPIAAFDGIFTYRDPRGVVGTPTFTLSFLGAWFKGQRIFRPGQEVTFPPISPPDDSSVRFEYLDVTVTGVLFADGTTWGASGESLRRRVLARLGALCTKLIEVLKVIQDDPPEEIERMLQGPGPLIQGQEQGHLVQRILRGELLDSEGRIHPDAVDRLRRVIGRLEDLIDGGKISAN